MYQRGSYWTDFNHLKPSGNFTYDQVLHSKILRAAHIVFMCFIRISEQTATFALKTLRNWFV
jgi:hypothetical protein